mmetsp:Transcript_44006/g.95629  ORF Transcript_44006/g.95629 Transcript_44006/m.95629 type:complete len:202 (+) Transcript_44006:1888-2493(+)
MLKVSNDAVKNLSLEVGRCDLQTLCGYQGNDCCNQGGPEIHRQLHDSLEVCPSGDLFAISPEGSGAKATRAGLVFLPVTSGTQIKIAGATTVGHVVRALHLIAANIALMTLEPRLKEKWVHMDVRDRLALLLGVLVEYVLQHEVFRIDHNHRKRLESPLQNQISGVVVIHNALDAVVEGHACTDCKEEDHDRFFSYVSLLH